MIDKSLVASGAMEGSGTYNRNAAIPAGGGALAFAHLEAAARTVPVDQDDYPFVVADYGSSEGKNSLAPVKVAVNALRQRLGPDWPILVYHTDLPANDFKSLFAVLENHPDRYTVNDPHIFPCAIGRSFYQQLLPAGHVALGWCSYAAMWVSQIPNAMPDHIFVPRMGDATRRAFHQQGAQDWEAFLTLRAIELRSGGRLVVVVPAAGEDGLSGYEKIMDDAYAVLGDMVTESAITARERESMVIGAWPRRRRDLLVPFEKTGLFCGLTVEHCETSPLPDAAWAAYDRDDDIENLVKKHAGFYRSIFSPTLALSLSRADGREARRAFGDRLEAGLTKRLMANPAPINSLVETMVFAKQG